MNEDLVRQRIARRMRELDVSAAALSREIGQNHSYIQQYMKYHKPEVLPFELKLRVHKKLGVTLAELGIDIPQNTDQSPGAVELGLESDATPFTVEAGDTVYDFLSPRPTLAYYRASSAALDKHPRLLIQPQDILIVDKNVDASDLKKDEAYLVQLYDKAHQGTVTTVIRQYVAPHLLVTNSSGKNFIMSLDDPSLPFEIVIDGRITHAIRNNVSASS